ncbi:MAG: hypothetical protein ACO3LE_09270 [Bdellovibrionota bacterium]
MKATFLFVLVSVFCLKVCMAQDSKPKLPKKEEAKTNTKNLVSIWEQPEWKSWLASYASSSPWIAKTKNWPPHYLMDNKIISQVKKADSKVTFKKPLFKGKSEVVSYDLFNSIEARRFESFDRFDLLKTDSELKPKELTKSEDRNKTMRANMIKMITNRSQDELNLFFVGAGHALDLFFGYFLKPDRPKKDPERKIYEEVIYVGRPIADDTLFFTQEYRDFIEASKGINLEDESVKDHSLALSIIFHARHFYYNSLKRDLIAEKDLLEEHPVRVGNLVVMDVHFIRSTEPFSKMPSAKALKSIGINKIRVGMEGWKFGESYKLSELERFYRVKSAGRFSKEDLSYFKRFRPKALKMYEKNFVTDVGLQALHQRLEDYEKNGIKVEVTGLEAVSRF